MSELYISVDVEAAGPIPGVYSMLSLGAVVVGDTKRTFYVDFKPINTASVPEAMKVIGRTLEDFERSGQDPKKAMIDFRDWIVASAGRKTPVFVGFNATFDWSFVNFYFHQYIGDNPFGFGGVDIKSFYMGLSGATWHDSRSSLLPAELKGSRPHTHNALDDALEQAEIFRRMRLKAAPES